MCKFFSFITDGKGKAYYFNYEQRQNMPIEGEPDSHSTIAEYYKPNKFDEKEKRADDVVNKYEYNPFTKDFIIDQINTKDDRELAEKWIKALDFKTIEPTVNFDKSFREPREIEHNKDVKDFEVQLLRDWDQLRDQLRYQFGYQLRDQLRDQLGYQLWDQLWYQLRYQLEDPLRYQLRDQLRDQLWDQLWDQLRYQLRDQLRDQLYSFGTTFVKGFQFENDTQEKLVNCINSLWLLGLMPLKINDKICLFTLNTCEKIYEEENL